MIRASRHSLGRALLTALLLVLTADNTLAHSAFVLPFQSVLAYPMTDEEGFVGTEIEWSAGPFERRSVHLVDNTQVDPSGHWGGYVRTMQYPVEHERRICKSTDPDYPGFGMVVNHVPKSSYNSVRQQGLAATLLFSGRNHAIYEYQWRYPMSGVPVFIRVQWLFTTGKPAPVYAITYDVAEGAPDKLTADSRAPYGELAWDGGKGAPIDGIGWGDTKQFRTLDAPVTFASGFDQTKDNVVPYTLAFAREADAEMGLVQTQTQAQHSAGNNVHFDGYHERLAEGPLPPPSAWPFQIHQWQLPDNIAGKRHAWGTPYGAIGHRAYPTAEGGVQTGWPYHSYSVYVVNDTHSRRPVAAQRKEVEHLQRGILTATQGATVKSRGPAGIGRQDERDFDMSGLNPIFNTWELLYTPGAPKVGFRLRAGSRAPIERPTFVIEGLSEIGEHAVVIDGHTKRAQLGYFLSEDKQNHRVWLTLDATVHQEVNIEINTP